MMTTEPQAAPALGAGLDEVAERDATGLVDDLYVDIRRTLGVPLVNLIYRHLATEPDVLRWAWLSVRPHMQSGAIAAQAAQLRGTVLQATLDWGVDVRPTASVQAQALVDTYSIANSLNLMALTHLLAGRAAPPLPPTPPTRTVATPPPAPLPPMPALADLPQADAQAVMRLNRLGEPGTVNGAGEPRIVASLYRHLAVWPGLPRQIEPLFEPLQRQGRLDAARLHAVQYAESLARHAPLPVAPRPAAFDDAFAQRVAQFAQITIPKMLPIGALLARALRSEGAPRTL